METVYEEALAGYHYTDPDGRLNLLNVRAVIHWLSPSATSMGFIRQSHN